MNDSFLQDKMGIYDYRILLYHYESDKKLSILLKWLKQVPVYSVWFFNASFDGDPGMLTLEEHKKRASHLSEIIQKINKINVIPAIDIVSTIGHLHIKNNIRKEFGFQTVVDSAGIESSNRVCMLDKKYLEYVFKMYQYYANTGARHIWPDDDIRIIMPLELRADAFNYCFCPLHLRKISDKTGKKWERENLLKVLSNPDEKEIHNAYFEISSNSVINLQKQIEKAVHGVDKNIRIGLMTCGANIGRDIDKELLALKGTGADPLIRLGGLYWQDDDLMGALKKIIRIRSDKPFEFVDLESSYELESYPLWPSLKSFGAIKLEMDLAILNGMDRIALLLFNENEEPIDKNGYYEKLLNESHDFHFSLKKAIADKKSLGVNIIRDRDYIFNSGFKNWSEILARSGIPTVSSLEINSPTVICDRVYQKIDDKRISVILEDGAIIEKDGLNNLIERKFFDSKDIEILNEIIDFSDIAYEKYTDNPFNGQVVNKRQTCYQTPKSFVIRIKNNKKFSVLSEWVDKKRNIIAPALILYNSKIPSLIFPYNISKGPAVSPRDFYLKPANAALLSEEMTYLLGRFLSSITGYDGIWVRNLNNFPVIYKGDNEVVIGIANFSLDQVENYSIWLSDNTGNPKEIIEMLDRSGKWIKVDFKLKKEEELYSGYNLTIYNKYTPMTVSVFKWKIN